MRNFPHAQKRQECEEGQKRQNWFSAFSPLPALSAIIRVPRTVILRLITLYQSTLSPDHGPLRHLFPYGYCPHHPTCSEFGKQVIERHGVILGTSRLIRRLLSCHPWTKPDEDAIRNAIEKTP